MERYLSANDAARILSVTAQSVHMMVRRGELRVAGETESGIRLFRREDVDRLATERQGSHGRREKDTSAESEEVGNE